MTDAREESAREGVTRALDALAQGDEGADRRLLEIVYGELRRLARRKMFGQPEGHTLQPTALVHEAWLRLVGRAAGPGRYPDRRYFFSAAATAMRSILVDHARRRTADKRGGGRERVTLSTELGAGAPEEEILILNDSLDRLRAAYPRQAQVVELLFFGGLSVPETAAALEVSERTVKRDWRFGKSWILARMEPGGS